MPKKEIPKTEAKKRIEEFFESIKQKSPEQFKKIKRIAMKNRISLKEYKALFCKKCLVPYFFPKVRIKNKMKTVECKNCGYILRKGMK